MQDKPPTTTFLSEIAPWIRGKSVAIYLRGRPKPITDVSIRLVGKHALIGRWNSSTHLVPLAAIDYIRFSPDCDPCRDPHHPLHLTLNARKPTQPKPVRDAQGTQLAADAIPGLLDNLRRLTE
jgi:hypothetical protein